MPDVDPRFAARLRELIEQRQTSYRALAARVHHGKTHVHDPATGRKAPTPDVARRLDEALGAGGELAALATAGTRRRPSPAATHSTARSRPWSWPAGSQRPTWATAPSTASNRSPTGSQWRTRERCRWICCRASGGTWTTSPRWPMLG